MPRFSKETLKNVLEKLYKGYDYRGEVVSIIQEEFISFSLDFFKKVVIAKTENQDINIDWYKKNFIEDKSLKKEEVSINSGINMKTISNKYKTTKKDVVIKASLEHYNDLKQSIIALTESDDSLNLLLTIKYNKASVELTLNETLLIVNALAVKRASIRGGAWSSIGKNIEKPLMKSLCILYGVKEENYDIIYKKEDYSTDPSIFSREIDFYLKNEHQETFLCEVKLMGKGNPESADAAFARNTNLLVADTLSDTNKRQLDNKGILWIELRSDEGFKKFPSILEKLKINYDKQDIEDDDIKRILSEGNIY